MDDALTRLIATGPTKEIRRIVMARFDDITAARQLGKKWKEIALALELANQHKSVAEIYWRVRRGVETNRLTLPRGEPQTTIPVPTGAPAPARQPQTRPPVPTGVPTPAGQPAKPQASGQNPSPRLPAPTSRRQSTKEFLASLEQIGGSKK